MNDGNQEFTSDQVQSESLDAEAKGRKEKKAARIEAYGMKGWKNTPWRRTFASPEKLAAWCEKNDATVLGTRDAD